MIVGSLTVNVGVTTAVALGSIVGVLVATAPVGTAVGGGVGVAVGAGLGRAVAVGGSSGATGAAHAERAVAKMMSRRTRRFIVVLVRWASPPAPSRSTL